jgi:eukaryotic-like serine/threonine-protein kinase
MVGETLSHYRVIELLGVGGMGEVYRAEDTRLKRSVALKVLPLALSQDPEAKERLLHEAQAASALDHPNICAIHEIDETPDGRLFVAMGYYDGETLKARIARGPLSIDEAVGIATKVARALGAAHDAGIIHRDVKPANIILTSNGDVKLVDFGIAKLSGQTALTRTGTTLGTVAYMSPEHVVGHAIDGRADVWSLGVVLYEMLAGRTPFSGDHEIAVIRAIADAPLVPLRKLRPDVPAPLDAIVAKTLDKNVTRRYDSARDLLEHIESLRGSAPTRGVTPPARLSRSWRGIGAIGAALLAVAAVGGWLMYRAAPARAARQRLPELAALIEEQRYGEAYLLRRQIGSHLAKDAEFIKLENSFLFASPVRTNPSGADVFWKPYDDISGDWEHVGQSPLTTRGPLAYFRYRVTKPGFAVSEGATMPGIGGLNVTLTPASAVPEGMVRVPASEMPISGGGSVGLAEFFIDRYEVTNRAFKAFVDAGGYRKREYWTVPFVKEGRALSWEEAAAEFRDETGRPGPSTWELGGYPDGQDDYPVRGVSWYEAAAFARFAGKLLPTFHHWRKAAEIRGVHSDILEASNFGGKGPARVGEFKGLGPYGTYDMAGNVKEWCWNAVGERRYILGAGWNEPHYQFIAPDARLPFDRSANIGFRTIKLTTEAAPELALRPVEQPFRDYTREKPAADDLFRAYVGVYSYDRNDFKASVVDDTSPSWRVERVSYAAPYGNERHIFPFARVQKDTLDWLDRYITAYLYVPKHAAAPYQTVVYFPHSGGFLTRSFQQGEMSYLGFIVKAGRALLFPMYQGLYERQLSVRPSGPSAWRDLIVQEVKDLRRSVDYLETRGDVDHERLSYFGVSYGARLGSIALATEKRFKAGVVWSGGLDPDPVPGLPEVDPINFAPRVTMPVLMLNGRDDFTFPIESSQLPMFRLLGTAEKRHVLYNGGHIFPFARVQKDTLDWLDRYLGVPK